MRIQFLMGDEFRVEVSKKVIGIGMYPAEVIIFTPAPKKEGVPEDAPIGLERLAFMFVVSELEGTHNFRGVILDPDKVPMGPEIFLGDGVVIEKSFSHLITYDAKPFRFKTGGIYHFVLFVDGAANDFTFEIRLNIPKNIEN